MPKVKVARKSTAIDMTAMCDVAFLLLTFFILTAKPRVEDPVPVDVPGSVKEIPIPDDNLAVITVGSGKAFFSVEGNDVRRQVLQQMGEKYGQQFTPEEYARFEVLPVFGVPIGNLKQFLNMDADQRKSYQQPGIPRDSVSDELFNWIRESRIAAKALHNTELRVSIKGDSKEEYPVVKDVVAILQRQKVNKFSLITTLRGASK
ncbi:biopolymer transporter ExbD [Mucilaginibacter sp. UR6-1]|uniref:ExbD/TolR family protein n=1 Tax=Mucilaginibacter sp. UR6-1 TaxID=1435643 RepID=UPI001E5EAC02|nr:biopolymer transporter ExbD [Mucilaginibacter sp. UR6-1]MCC8409408.1 biopolymer transporter ExbD [Mucilaginibacter sp. UR6-1]